MKILYINTTYGRGSTGRGIQDLKAYCDSRGDTVFVATSEPAQIDNHYRIGNILDHKIHAFLSRLFCKQAGFSTIETFKFIRWVKKICPDIIQINNIHSNFINIYQFLKFTAKEKIPVVLVLDDCWFYTGNCCHYTTAGCNGWKTGCGNCPQLDKGNKSFFYDGTKRNLANKKNVYENNRYLGVVGVSQWITNEAKASILKNSLIIRRIYNSIDMEIFKPSASAQKPSQHKEQKIILGVATYWDSYKGLHHFNSLAEELDKQYQIILIGGGNKKDMHPKIKHIPHTENINELVYYYNIADVFVQMSTEESFGKVCAEALACGTPIAVFDSTASPELVGANCGEIAIKDNLYDMKEKIIKICSQEKNHYSDNCISFARENFDSQKNIEKYYELYKELSRSSQ